MNYESYYITEEEFYFLLAGKGIPRWYGMTSDAREFAPEGLDKEDLYRILGRLYQKGLVSWKGNLVKLEGAASEMMDILLPSRCCMRLEQEESQGHVIFYFHGNRAVMLEMSHTELRTFRMSILLQQEVTDYLIDNEVLPEENPFYDESEEEEAAVEGKNSRTVATLTFLHPRMGKEIEKILVKEEGIDTFLHIIREGVHQSVHYSPEVWKNEILTLCSAHNG